jgi:hypothetical protein
MSFDLPDETSRLYRYVRQLDRRVTKYILLTGPAGSTTARLAPRLQSILNEPLPIERLLHLNVVPDFELRPSCGALDTIAQIP